MMNPENMILKTRFLKVCFYFLITQRNADKHVIIGVITTDNW